MLIQNSNRIGYTTPFFWSKPPMSFKATPRKNISLRSLRLVRILFLLALIFSPMGASPARAAAGCVVTTAADSGAGSLREKMAYAACPTITFANDYTILLSTTLVIERDLTIDGVGDTITISGQDTVRVFSVTSVTASLNSLTITQGNTTE
jgi:hypothetical protein